MNSSDSSAPGAQPQPNDFLSAASHELKSPLTVISAFAQLLEVEISQTNNPKMMRHLQHITEKTAVLNRLISDVFDVLRLEKGSLQLHDETVRVQPWLSDTIASIQSTISTHRLRMVGTVAGEVVCDPDRLRSILTVLISFAAARTANDHHITIQVKSTQMQLHLSVHFQGKPLTSEERKTMFLPFVGHQPLAQDVAGAASTEPKTGLEFYLARKIAEHYGGTLQYKTRAQKELGVAVNHKASITSSGFMLTLPLHRPTLYCIQTHVGNE